MIKKHIAVIGSLVMASIALVVCVSSDYEDYDRFDRIAPRIGHGVIVEPNPAFRRGHIRVPPAPPIGQGVSPAYPAPRIEQEPSDALPAPPIGQGVSPSQPVPRGGKEPSGGWSAPAIGGGVVPR